MRRNSHGAGAGRKLLFLNAMALLALQAPANAGGLSPYLPLHLDPQIERAVERVLILADKPALTRPVPASLVLDALPAACKADKPLCDRVWRYLDRLARRSGMDVAGFEVAASSGADVALPNRQGLTNDSAWQAAIRAHFQPSAYLLLNLGGVAYDGRAVPAGSVLSVGFDAAQLDLGYRDRWLSPMEDGAMLLGAQAPTMPSVTLANSRPLTRFGFRYEAFGALMSASDSIAIDTGFTSGHPRLAGLHLSTEPVPGWSLGLNRLMQFGGGARGGNSLKDLFSAFFQPSQFDNVGPGGGAEDQFGNQLASFTSRFIYPGATPFAVYFEYAGEDTSRSQNYLLGNSALSLGFHIPQLWQRFDLAYEVSEWQNGWYVNGLYGDGLTHEGHVLGHWGGDWRQPGDGVGAQTHTLRLGWAPRWGGWMEMRYRTLRNESYGATDYARASEAELQYSRRWRQLTLGVELVAGRDVFGEDFSRGGAFIRYDRDSTGLGFTPGRTPAAESRGAELFVDTGATAHRVRIDLTSEAAPLHTGMDYAPHFAIGARRAVSDSSDLGVRLELDDIDGHRLVAVRMLDYRYRFGSPLALSAFFGAARYGLATPAYGIYAGVGAQWRDVAPKWDLGLDLRTAFKVARDHLLPEDPPVGREDSFYDIYGATLYLSRRF